MITLAPIPPVTFSALCPACRVVHEWVQRASVPQQPAEPQCPEGDDLL